MAAPPRVVEPPFYDPPLTDYPSGQRHSQAWTEYHQAVSDKLTALHAGVTDGSDATAGDVGEYVTASGSTALTSNAAANIASLSLAAGDWDVRGQAAFSTTLGVLETRAWVGTASASPTTLGESVISLAGTGAVLAAGTQLLAGPVRFSLSATTTIYLGGLARFTSGTASANGTISARRMR